MIHVTVPFCQVLETKIFGEKKWFRGLQNKMGLLKTVLYSNIYMLYIVREVIKF